MLGRIINVEMTFSDEISAERVSNDSIKLMMNEDAPISRRIIIM